MSAREPLSAAQLAEYLALEAAATAGPWVADVWEIYAGRVHGQWIAETCEAGNEARAVADARFIAEAREMVPALLAEVARLTSAPAQILAQAERVVRQQQGRGATAAEIVQALVDAALLKSEVRPGVEPAAEAVRLRAALAEIAGYCRKERCDFEPESCPSARARQALANEGGAQ
jgi:hypothetical protein